MFVLDANNFVVVTLDAIFYIKEMCVQLECT